MTHTRFEPNPSTETGAIHKRVQELKGLPVNPAFRYPGLEFKNTVNGSQALNSEGRLECWASNSGWLTLPQASVRLVSHAVKASFYGQ